jgi:hypothetical protein
MEDFLVLLALGYEELAFADFTQTPGNELYINVDFQKWVCEMLNITLPKNGLAIVEEAQKEFGDINAWLKERCSWG